MAQPWVCCVCTLISKVFEKSYLMFTTHKVRQSPATRIGHVDVLNPGHTNFITRLNAGKQGAVLTQQVYCEYSMVSNLNHTPSFVQYNRTALKLIDRKRRLCHRHRGHGAPKWYCNAL